VKDIMTHDPVCVTADVTARELARVLESNEISGVPVVDAVERVIGVVSKTDLLHRCLEGPLGSRPGTFFEVLAEGMEGGTDLDPEELGTVEEFMTPEPVTALPDEPVGTVARRMADNHVHRVIVVDEQQHVLGIVTSLDLLKVFPT
jgi:CBS domain-containing protein